MRLWVVVLLLSLARPVVLEGQSDTTKLYGQVIDQAGQPSYGARVLIFATDTIAVSEPATTDKNGHFHLAFKSREGCYLITVRAPGYFGTDRTIRLNQAGRFNIGVINIRQLPIEEIRLIMNGCPHPLAGRNALGGVEVVPASSIPLGPWAEDD
jgi:hypothetical protein